MKKPQKEELSIDKERFCFNIFELLSERNYLFAHPHWHEVCELCYIKRGSAKQQINGEIFNISQGDIIFINSNSIHSIYTAKKEKNILTVMHFSSLLIHNLKFSAPLTFGSSNFSLNVPDKISSYTVFGQKIVSLIDTIYNEFIKKEKYFEAVINGLLLEFVSLLAREFGISEKNITSTQIKRVRNMLGIAFEYIDVNFKEDIRLENIANASRMSISNFCRVFRKATGMTFIEYLTLYRVNYSEKLLLTTEKTITDIAYESGFNSNTSFIRAFRKLNNTAPSIYRKNYFD